MGSIRVQLKARRPELPAPPMDTMMLSTRDTGPRELDSLVRHLLDDACPSEATFLFWSEGRRIHGPLDELLDTLQLSREATLLVEYDLQPPHPQPDVALPEPDWIRTASIGPTGEIVTGSFDRLVRLYRRPFTDPPILGKAALDTITAVDWLDQRRFAAGSADGSIRIWTCEVETGKLAVEQRLRGHDSSIQSLVVSPDGKHLYSADYDGNICQYLNAPDAGQLSPASRSLKPSHKHRPTGPPLREQSAIKTWQGNNSTIATLLFESNGNLMCVGWDGRVALFSHPDCHHISSSSLTKDVSTALLVDCAGSTRLITGHADGSLRGYDPCRLDSGCVSLRRSAHDGWVSGLASDGSGHFVSCGHDGAVGIWDGQDLSEPLTTIRERSQDKILAVDWRDGVLAFVGQEKTLFTFGT